MWYRIWPYWLIPWIIVTSVYAATYSINTNSAGEAVLDEAQQTTHQGLTKTQILQRSVNAFLQGLFAQQNSHASREINDKLAVATPASKVNAKNALNAGISLPTITTIPTQNSNVNDVVAVTVTASDPDGLPLVIKATGLPPGITVGTNPTTGAHELHGTLTTSGTYNPVVRAYKFSDIYGETTFLWNVAP